MNSNRIVRCRRRINDDATSFPIGIPSAVEVTADADEIVASSPLGALLRPKQPTVFPEMSGGTGPHPQEGNDLKSGLRPSGFHGSAV